MRLLTHWLTIFCLGGAIGPCERLCELDGSSVCSGGSWSREGPTGQRCHAYFRSLNGRHCYHNAETASVCPDTLLPLTVEDARSIIAILRSFFTGGPRRVVALVRGVPRDLSTTRRVVAVTTQTPAVEDISAVSGLQSRTPRSAVDDIPAVSGLRSRVPQSTTTVVQISRPTVPFIREFPTITPEIVTTPVPSHMSAADNIGLIVESGRDWQQVAITIASILSRPEVDTWPELSLDETVEFWRRCRGDLILSLARANTICQLHGADECFSLMLLVGNMPLPVDSEQARHFLTRFGILDFVADRADQLSRRLLSSLPTLTTPQVPSLMRRRIDLRGIGVYNGYATNWIVRFSSVFTRVEHAHAVLRHGMYRYTAAHEMSSLRRLVSLDDVDRIFSLEHFNHQLMKYNPSEIRNGINEVKFAGEDAYGEGLIREWFSVVSAGLFGSVFERRPDSDIDQFVNSSTTITATAVGRYLALCIVHGVRTSLNLSVGFFKLLVGLENIKVADIEEIDPDLYKSISVIEKARTEDELAALRYGIEDESLLGSGLTEPLTLTNKHEQIEASLVNLITNNSPRVFSEILDGFRQVIPPHLMRGIDASVLKKIICADPTIDADEFFDNIDFVGEYWTSTRIGWVRETFFSFSQDKLRNFLRFVTGSQVVPVGGFSAMGKIRINAHARRSPMAHTCFKSLDWPLYESAEVTREVLTYLADFGNLVAMSETR